MAPTGCRYFHGKPIEWALPSMSSFLSYGVQGANVPVGATMAHITATGLGRRRCACLLPQ